MTVITFFSSAFPALVLAHFVALLSPGQDFFLIIGHAIRHKLKGSKYICLGIALGNGIYIGIAIIGWASIKNNVQIFGTIKILGALYLIWIGLKLIQSKKQNTLLQSNELHCPSIVKQLILGMNSALLNPKNALFYMSLMTTILGSNATLTQQITSGVWMFLMVFFWDLLIASIIGQSKVQHYLIQSIHIIERGAGIILIVLGVGLICF